MSTNKAIKFDAKKVGSFGSLLLNWYSPGNRPMPWKEIEDPYRIWISEIMLQQTRVDQVVPFYSRFIDRFPDVFKLAEADLDEVLVYWEGLGYYSRARNLHAAAHQVVYDYKGVFPNSYDGLLALKGIGPYTAAAVSSFAFGESKAVLDGNVYRILSRVFNLSTPVNATQGKKTFQSLANQIISDHDPGRYNQAIMDHGATICTPANPLCEACCFKGICAAYSKGLVADLPVKQKKPDKKARYFHYLLVLMENSVLVKQRDTTDIWKGLYEFPLVELSKNDILSPEVLHDLFPLGAFQKTWPMETSRQQLTHQTINAVFYQCQMTKAQHVLGGQFVPIDELENLAMPKTIRRFATKHLIHR